MDDIIPVSMGIANGIDPCPLCGGKEGETVLLGFKFPYYIISCTDCNLRIHDDRKDKVQGKWNTRDGVGFWDKIKKQLPIEKTIRTQVEDCTDYVGEFFASIYKNYEGDPLYETQDFNNSDTRMSTLKCGQNTVALVIETRTELNNVEFIFCRKPVIDFEAENIERKNKNGKAI